MRGVSRTRLPTSDTCVRSCSQEDRHASVLCARARPRPRAARVRTVGPVTPEIYGYRTVNDRLALLWVGCGTEDALFNSNKEFAELLESSVVRRTVHVTEGAPTWPVRRRYLHHVAPLLFG
jgi:hypothetical protein